MKEVTYEDWMENPTPRMMWVWDSSEKRKKQGKVIYFARGNITYPVIVLINNDMEVIRYAHCAEIEKPRRMTQKELSRWLREKPTREYKHSCRTDIVVNCFYSYIEEDADQEVDEYFLIREDDGEWQEPLMEME